MADYLKTADVWTVLDLIVAEFTSDPMSVQWFDLRIVDRAKELNREHHDDPDERGPVLRLSERLQRQKALNAELLAALQRLVRHDEVADTREGLPNCVELEAARAAIAHAEGR